MKTLIDTLVLGMFGLLLVGGIYYSRNEILHEVRVLALVKAHKGLGSMESIAHKLTSRK